MATRQARVSEVSSDGLFSIVFDGPQLLEAIDEKYWFGDAPPVKGDACTLEYQNSRFVVVKT
ncbi:MAG: hypothetical protein WA674_04870 [Candidatus Acidiferrales bacterium]